MDLPSSARLWSKTDAQAATAPANRRVRWFALRWLGVAVGTGLAGFLLWRIGPDRIGSVVGGANVPLLAGAIGLNVPVIAFRAWRTRALLGRLHAAVPLLDVAEAQLVGQTLSGLTPAASGDLSRAYLWNRRSGVPVATGALVVVAERVLSLLLLVAVGLAALGMAFGGWQARALAALALGIGALPWLGARLGLLSRLLAGMARLPLVRRRAALAERLARNLVVVTGDGGLMVRFNLLTAAVFAFCAAQVWLLAVALGATLGWPAALAGYCLSQAGGSLSNLPFGLGPGDGLLVVLAAWDGTAIEAAAGIAVLFRLTTTVPIALGAVIAWGRR